MRRTVYGGVAAVLVAFGCSSEDMGADPGVGGGATSSSATSSGGTNAGNGGDAGGGNGGEPSTGGGGATTTTGAGGGQIGNSPYLGSQIIASLSLDWASHDRRANGSDNFAITWADDGHQYTMWGDGWGFENQPTKMSLGVSRVEGDAGSYMAFDVFGAPNGATFAGKSYGIISIGGDLYGWWGPGSGTASYAQTRLMVSTDKGASWTKSTWDLTDASDTLIMPTILNFAQDYAGALDGFVYHYFIRKQGSPGGLGVHVPGMIDLARVPTGSLMDVAAYEYFAGLNGGMPEWTTDATARMPVFENPAGVGWNLSVSYNAGLGRYILATEHAATFSGNVGFYDAGTPWGPWTTVAYFEAGNGGVFGEGDIETSTFFWNFANKWSSPDGEGFVLVFSGVGQNDSWNSVEGSFGLY